MGSPCLIPLVTAHGCVNPAELYLSLRGNYDSSFLLESLTEPGEKSRYPIIGCGWSDYRERPRKNL